jgi:hypothetical protein
MQSIQFHNNINDIQDYFHFWAFKTPKGEKWVRQSHVIGQSAYLIGALLIWGFSNNFWIALGVWLVFEIGLLIRTGFRPGRWITQRNIQNWLKPFTGKELENLSLLKSIEISEQTLLIQSEAETHSYTWKRVKKVDRSTDSIFIYCGMRTIFVIPKRALDSQSEFDGVYEMLLSKLENSSQVNFPSAGDIIFDQ